MPQASSPFSPSRWARFGVITLLLAGFALRLHRLGSESLWYDETVSVYLASQPLTGLISHTARDIHPPVYYMLLHLWRQISYPSVAFGLEHLYAWPNVWLAMLVMALTYAVAKRCFGLAAAHWGLALALVHATQIWSAQEVRMYALGALCLMLTLWAVSPLLTAKTFARNMADLPKEALLLYPLAALVGLYTLYYFLFWLVVLNLALVIRLRRHAHALRSWIILQILVVVGWLPWLPIFVRQAVSPPVPPWRAPWQNAIEVVEATSEALAALWVGHTPPLITTWPWAILVLGVATAFFVYAKRTAGNLAQLWLLLAFGAPFLLLIITLLGVPIYHVRYVATYAPVFVLLVAALIANFRPPLAALLAFTFTTISAAALHQLWTNPLYAADDHRGAVAMLAEQWRPGDTILVNAGWVYTALSVYWPTELPSPHASRPPSIADIVRLDASTAGNEAQETTGPVLYRTGSVGGDPGLGWGLPASDFFAISAQETTETLAQLAAGHARIWHYRLYDTVNDPDGIIRQWFEGNTTRDFSQAIPGRDYLLVEAYRTGNTLAVPPPHSQAVQFVGAGITLSAHEAPPALAAGETLYTKLFWQMDSVPLATPVALSLRLYDAQGRLIAQNDTPLASYQPESIVQTVALPVPADTLPTTYQLGLVVYSPETLIPFAPKLTQDETQEGATVNILSLGELTIQLPQTIPHAPAPFAIFDYIELLQADLPSTPVMAGAVLETAWGWRPRQSAYRDHYRAQVELVSAESGRVLLGSFDLGGDAYPSSMWAAGFPIRQHVQLTLPDSLPAGTYRAHLSIFRAADGRAIPARRPWWPFAQPTYEVAQIKVIEAE